LAALRETLCVLAVLAEPAPPANGGAGDPNDAPSVFTALQEQLGLKLEPDTMPLQFVVIDHIERPTDN